MNLKLMNFIIEEELLKIESDLYRFAQKLTKDNAEDALEFILAGATAVSIGAMNFVNPYTTVETVDGIEHYMKRYGIEDINTLIGAVK